MAEFGRLVWDKIVAVRKAWKDPEEVHK